MIPLFSLERQNQKLSLELHEAINEVINSGVFILGPKVSELEKKLAIFLGVKFAVGVASGTDAISLGLLSLGLQEGDEIIMPANSYPSAFGITAIGAVPRLVDIDPDTFTIDPNLIEKAITPKTKAILAVHLYGQPADLNSIIPIARKHNLNLVEDCAQAIGAEIKITQLTSNPITQLTKRALKTPPRWQADPELVEGEAMTPRMVERTKKEWRKVGSIGDIGCFSFYPTKNLGCFGDGGMVTTNNEEIYKKLKLYRMYGESKRYNSVLLGKNSRLDELQAAILLVKLKYLDEWNARRKEIANLYNSQFSKLKLCHFEDPPAGRDEAIFIDKDRHAPIKSGLAMTKNRSHVYHLFVIRSERRDDLKAYLESKGILTGIHYPVPIHLEPSFKFLGHKKGDFPESEKANEEILSLPMYPELIDSEIEIVVKAIKDSFVHFRDRGI